MAHAGAEDLRGARLEGEPRARDLAVEVAKLRDEDGGRDELASWLDRLEAMLRDAMVLGEAEGAAESSTQPHLMNAAATKASEAIASRLPPTKAVEALAEIESVRDDLALHMGAKVVLTHLLLRIHALRG